MVSCKNGYYGVMQKGITMVADQNGYYSDSSNCALWGTVKMVPMVQVKMDTMVVDQNGHHGDRSNWSLWLLAKLVTILLAKKEGNIYTILVLVKFITTIINGDYQKIKSQYNVWENALLRTYTCNQCLPHTLIGRCVR